MLSKTTVFIVAALLHTSVFCVTVEHLAAYDRVAKCFKDGYNSQKELEPLIEGELNYRITVHCHFGKVCRTCLAEPFDSSTGSSEILDFFRAFQWQRAILESKSKLCTVPNLEKLKKLVDESGIMEEENLTSIENDSYDACVGDFYRKCMIGAEKTFEHHGDIIGVVLHIVHYFVDKDTPQTCQTPIAMMTHMRDLMQAVLLHLREKHGLMAHLMHHD